MSKNITHLHKGNHPDLAQQISRHQPKTNNLIYVLTLCKMLQQHESHQEQDRQRKRKK